MVRSQEINSCSNNDNGNNGGVCETSNVAGAPKQCEDLHPNCRFWANRGECESNPTFMLHQCSKTCRSCTLTAPEPWMSDVEAIMKEEEEEEEEEDEEGRELEGADEDDAVEDKDLHPELLFGVKQDVEGDNKDEILKTIAAAVEYVNNVVLADPERFPPELVEACYNQDKLCAFWATVGECEVNPAYMKINCAPVCQTCDYLDHKTRCPLDPNAKDALLPGDLNRMFERIAEQSTKYNLTIHSRPFIEGHEGFYGRPLKDGQIDGPWVVSFKNFLTAAETDKLIEFGFEEGYERSTDVGGAKIDGTYEAVESEGRTSTNAWCQGKCDEDEVTRGIWSRIEEVTGISEKNSEHFQILRYEPGQYYNIHHDFIEMDVGRPSGPRILTFFLYLNDVEEGGGTR
jgi:prolyl 4-hydroxylase